MERANHNVRNRPSLCYGNKILKKKAYLEDFCKDGRSKFAGALVWCFWTLFLYNIYTVTTSKELACQTAALHFADESIEPVLFLYWPYLALSMDLEVLCNP